jgi:hypothetical protein
LLLAGEDGTVVVRSRKKVVASKKVSVHLALRDHLASPVLVTAALLRLMLR